MAHTTTDLPGLGTKLQVKIAGSYVDIPELSDIEWGDFSLGIRNPNVLADRKVRKRPTITNLGKVSGTVYHDPNDTTHQALQGKVLAPPTDPDEFVLIFADSLATPAKIEFKGYVTEWPLSGIEVEGTVESKFAVEVTDLFTPTPGVAAP